MRVAETVAALIAGAILAAQVQAATPADAAVKVLTQGYVAAWNRADARRIAGFFAADGDFTNPTGFHAAGRPAIGGFYARAFGAGYAGSRGGFTLTRARRIAPDVVLTDGEWSIEGARTPQGGPRPAEHGSAFAVLRRTSEGWRVAALREQEAR